MLHRIDRVGRACGMGRMPAVQHRNVIVMISRRQDPERIHPLQPAKLPEGRAFMVIAMTKSQIDRIALPLLCTLSFGEPLHHTLMKASRPF